MRAGNIESAAAPPGSPRRTVYPFGSMLESQALTYEYGALDPEVVQNRVRSALAKFQMRRRQAGLPLLRFTTRNVGTGIRVWRIG